VKRDDRGLDYQAAGVSIEAGDRAVALMRDAVARTSGPEVIGGIGGFAGLFDASRLTGYRRPLLATATDGVGTKVVIAQRLRRYGTVGLDLVAMVVDDLVTCGAEPLFMTDYVVFGTLVAETAAEVVGGVARGCELAGCALLGGETAEHPGHLGPDDFDLAGAAILALGSSGLHANGYSLVRRVIADARLPLDAEPPELGRALGDELLTPTTIYARDCLALAAACDVHALAHVTGGGLAANLARVIPPAMGATLDRGTWSPPAVFPFLAGHGGIGQDEMERVFNMGVGMAAVMAADDADRALRLLEDRGVPAWRAGEVTSTGAGVRLVGTYRT